MRRWRLQRVDQFVAQIELVMILQKKKCCNCTLSLSLLSEFLLGLLFSALKRQKCAHFPRIEPNPLEMDSLILNPKTAVRPPEKNPHILWQWYVNFYRFWVFRKIRWTKESILYILYCIDRRVYLNLFKSTQSAAGPGMKALKPAANDLYTYLVQGIWVTTTRMDTSPSLTASRSSSSTRDFRYMLASNPS